MPRARVQPSGINPLAVALGNVFEEFREAPNRRQRFETGELENLEILFSYAGLLRSTLFESLLTAELRLMQEA